jgi:hypothetical protein
VNFFFDRCVGVRLARMLHAYDGVHTIIHLDDDNRFERDSEDTFIINTVGADTPKPVYFTADLNNRKKPNERAALRDSEMTVVFFKDRFNNIDFHIQAVKLLTLWPIIIRDCERCPEPTAFEISPAANKPNRFCLTREL